MDATKFEGSLLCTLPGQVVTMEKVGGFIVCKIDDGRSFVVTPEGEVRDISGQVQRFVEMMN
jgi:hypothetical protein